MVNNFKGTVFYQMQQGSCPYELGVIVTTTQDLSKLKTDKNLSTGVGGDEHKTPLKLRSYLAFDCC